jgi:CheY-like chemotaxis protein
MSEPLPPIRILVVEDEPGDVRLLEEALKALSVAHDLRRAATGSLALDELRAEGKGRPDVVLLDLNLPGMDGRKVLAAIRGDKALAGTKVVVVTASPSDADVLTAFDLRADAYLRKPIQSEELGSTFTRLFPRPKPPTPEAAEAAPPSPGLGDPNSTTPPP